MTTALVRGERQRSSDSAAMPHVSRVGVGEDGDGADVGEGCRSGHPRGLGHDHLVARAEVEGQHREVQGRGAVGHRRRVGDAEVVGELALEQADGFARFAIPVVGGRVARRTAPRAR